jgi:hypothetical protein
MGREIRQVPPNWEHPQRDPEHDTYRHGGFQPMHDRHYDDAKREWIEGLAQWEAGTFPGQDTYTGCEWWDYAGDPPVKAYYRPWKDDEATWFQLWETVSEGTPVSPPFATREALADHLAEHGDGGWGASRPGGWGKERAYRFVMDDGWAPSMVVSDGKIMSGVEFVTTHPKTDSTPG